MIRAAIGFAGRFTRSRRGGAAVMVAMAMPPLALLSLGALQLQAVFADKQKTQDVADAAALWGAQQLTITPTGADSRTIAYANAQLADVRANATVTVTATIIGRNNIKVAIDTNRPSFFFNLFPAGGFNTHAESGAEGLTQTPLCVLIIGSGSSDDINVTSSSKLQAPACLVHSNHNVTASSTAMIRGQTVEAGGTASGPITPSPSTGAPAITDPFANLNVDTAACLVGGLVTFTVQNGATYSLPPGLHLFNYDIKNGSTLSLQPGDHYFCGGITLRNYSNLIGDDVVLIYGPGADSSNDWSGGANVNLNGRKSGNFAGFVLIDSRSDSGNFDLFADPISNITGAIYVPSARLRVNGTKLAANGSAWTVVAAKAFETNNLANLQINVNYAGSSVPVPNGVGNKTGTTHLH